jgi:glycosyltransferase involved in cell wall biosynthesis
MNNSGYAQAARDYISSLVGSHEIRLNALDGGPEESLVPSSFNLYNKLKSNPKSNKAIQIFQTIPDIQRRFYRQMNEKTLGFAVFEAEKPPKHWADILNLNSAVVAPSEFCADIFSQAGVYKPIHKVCHCIDLNKYNLNIKKVRLYEEFTFLFFGSWKTRKGHKELISAWLNYFGESDGVRLVIKTDEPKIAEMYIEIQKRKYKKSFAPITIESRKFNEDELPSFIKSHDSLVFPTKGEGFGLPGLQAIALGVPLIVTNYSGVTEYADHTTCYLLTPEKMEDVPCMDNYPQFRNQQWAYVSPEQIAQSMKDSVSNQKSYEARANKAAEEVAPKFSYANTLTQFNAIFATL